MHGFVFLSPYRCRDFYCFSNALKKKAIRSRLQYFVVVFSMVVTWGIVSRAVLPDDIPNSQANPHFKNSPKNAKIYSKTAQNRPTLQFLCVPSLRLDVGFKVTLIPTTCTYEIATISVSDFQSKSNGYVKAHISWASMIRLLAS